MEQADGTHFLVMELIEGETLAERIQRGPLPAEEAFRISHQIADALEAAHEKGIIHRDLKPANIKITPEGKVKVLDFGLARAMEEVPAPANSNSPTISALATNAGIILGTAGYMSPEQARGHTADQRSDIFSFGCVLYEMLTGRQPFPGETITDIIASVVARDPDWRAIPANLHPKTEELVRRCLAKNRKDRYHSIADVRVELETILADPQGLKLQSARSPHQRPLWKRAIPFALTAALAAAIAVAIMLMMRTGLPTSAILTRFSFVLPEDQVFTNPARNVISISPDGASIAYVANEQLYLKTMGEMQARPIPGTGPTPFGPFFSPDGRWVAFGVFSEKKLKKISIAGGPAVTISDFGAADDFANSLLDASWGPDDQILIGWQGAILRVPANGGNPERLITLKEGEAAHRPQILPGGAALLFTLGTTTVAGPGAWDKAQIVVQSLSSGERKVLIEGGTDARYSPTGHIVYVVGTTLLAVPFDVRNLRVTGGPVPIVESVRRSNGGAISGGGSAYFAFSSTGSIVYIPNVVSGTQPLSLELVERTGARKALDIPIGPHNSPRVSPDGKQLAWWTEDTNESNVWVYSLSGSVPPRRFTFGGRNYRPIWTKDGQRIAFTSDREGEQQALFWQAADGSGAAERLFIGQRGERIQSESWLPDGKTLIYYAVGGDIWMVSLGSGEKPTKLIPGANNPNLSPDGRWLAYSSSESGRVQVYVQPFPLTGAKYQISTAGGDNVIWSPDGKQLYYLNEPGNAQRQIYAVDIQTTPSFVIGKTTPLPIRIMQSGARDYDITPDGKYFVALFAAPEANGDKRPPEHIYITLNWFEDLKQRAPVK
jgi:serine/threonine-protein kinase